MTTPPDLDSTFQPSAYGKVPALARTRLATIRGQNHAGTFGRRLISITSVPSEHTQDTEVSCVKPSRIICANLHYLRINLSLPFEHPRVSKRLNHPQKLAINIGCDSFQPHFFMPSSQRVTLPRRSRPIPCGSTVNQTPIVSGHRRYGHEP